MTAAELVAIWPEKWPRPEPETTRNCASQLKHFAAYFGDRPLAEITRADFRRFAMEHPGAARYARAALADAFDEGLVEENVAANVRVKLPAKKAVRVPTTDEVAELTYHAARVHGPFAQMVEFCAYTGLREGEARALAREDLLGGGRAQVLYSMNREERLKEPKTTSSKAPFALLGPTRTIVAGRLRDAGDDLTPVRAGRLFPFTRRQVASMWTRTRYEAKLDDVKFHALRHFCATDLLNRGATMDDVALQMRCSVDEIRKTYGHPDRDAALSRLEAL